METLRDKVYRLYVDSPEEKEKWQEIYQEVSALPSSAERSGVLAFLYHEGLGVEKDLEKSFALVEEALDKGGDDLAYYILGFMCDQAETPDQKTGGDRQKYDHYDAERFYQLSSEGDSCWSEEAHLWLGEYFLDSARGGDPEEGLDQYKAIAEKNAEAAARLSDYYWDLVMPDGLDDEEWCAELFKWTVIAARLDPGEYEYRLGWLLLDGIGCDADEEEAMKCLHTAYEHGDWRGAKTIADLLSNKLENIPDNNLEEKKSIEKDIALWKDRASAMKEEEDLESEGEENCIEED